MRGIWVGQVEAACLNQWVRVCGPYREGRDPLDTKTSQLLDLLEAHVPIVSGSESSVCILFIGGGYSFICICICRTICPSRGLEAISGGAGDEGGGRREDGSAST